MASVLLKSRRRGRVTGVPPGFSSKKPRAEDGSRRVVGDAAPGWERQKFLRLFQGGFARAVSVPYDQAIDFYAEAGKMFNILGPSEDEHQVRLDRLGDEMVFTEGWPGVVFAEGIGELDVALFARSGDDGIKMTVYRRTGEEKMAVLPKSFLRLFRYGFSQLVDITDGTGRLFEGKTGEAVTIIGPSGREYAVVVELLQGDLYLSDGWERVVRSEGIQQMDVGHFLAVSDGRFELTVFNRSGVEKAPYDGPVEVAIEDSLLPWEEVRWHAQANTLVSPFVKHRIHCLWINCQKQFDLYVGRLTRAQANGPWMYFMNAFSYQLPAHGRLMMRFSGRAVETEGAIARVHGSARIVEGWQDFVLANNIAAGSTYIFKFFMLGGILRLTMYNA